MLSYFKRENDFYLLDKIQILVCLMSLNSLTKRHDSSDYGRGAVVHTVVVTVQRRSGRGLHLLNKSGHKLIMMEVDIYLDYKLSVLRS